MPSRELGERWPNLLAVGGHPAVDMPPHVVEAAARAAQRAPYAPTRGLPALREAIAAEHGVDPDRNVIVTLGGMQGLYLAARAFGQRAVSHAPSFFFPQLIEAAGGECTVAYGWDEYAAALGPGTTLAIVNTPVNPTGYAFRQSDLDAIAAALASNDVLLLSDEAYFGVLYDGVEHLSPASHPELAERTLVLRSFSKTLGMAAWRIGYAVGPEWAIDAIARELQWQALAIDGVAQSAALAALTGPRDWIDAAIAELAVMRPQAIAAANEAGLRCELPEGCAFIWAEIDGDEDETSDGLAREYGIPALPGRHFHARTPHLRIPFGGRPGARAQLLEQLRRAGPRFLVTLLALALTATVFWDRAAQAAEKYQTIPSSEVRAALLHRHGFVRSGLRLQGDLVLQQLDVAGPFRCRRCILEGRLLAADATFHRTVDLSGSQLRATANFEGATFFGPAVFGRGPGPGDFATFSDEANFAYATFDELATFQSVRFEHGAEFSLARFQGDAAFSEARFFGQDVFFYSTQFSGEARFDQAAFEPKASFRRAAFGGPADFSQARFGQTAGFSESHFAQGGTFLGAEFRSACPVRAVSFEHVLATKALDFTAARFAGPAVFTSVSAEGLNFADTQFSGGRTQTKMCHPARGVALRGGTVGDLVMAVDSATANVTDVPRTALERIEASAKARGDLRVANDAHYRLRVLKSSDYWWPWHVLDVVFYRSIAGYLVRPLRPLLTLLSLAFAVFLLRSARRALSKSKRYSVAKSELAVRRPVFDTVARGSNELLDTFTAIWPRKPDPQASDWTRLGRRLESLAYRLLIVCVLLGVANSNPTLRQMLDAIL